MGADDRGWFSPGEGYADDGLGLQLRDLDQGLQSIKQIAHEFGVTPRALRFYEAKGLLKPQREGSVRRYGPSERRRLALLLKAKALGFTLAEIHTMIGDRATHAEVDALDIGRRQCIEQIRLLERRKGEIEAALAELRRAYSSLYARLVGASP